MSPDHSNARTARLAFVIAVAAYWVTLWLPPIPGSWILKCSPMLIAAVTLGRCLKPAAAWPMAIGFVSAAGGDLFLAMDRHAYFTFGLGCFLVTQLAYATAFHRHRCEFLGRWPWWLPVIAFGLAVLAWMWPVLGDDRVAVTVYVSALVVMAVTAAIVERHPGRLFAGAVLFVLSDALIGVTRFVADFDHSVSVVIALYMIAQYLIFTGSLAALPRRRSTG
jgi:uncharacterized membrane protein YhhN